MSGLRPNSYATDQNLSALFESMKKRRDSSIRRENIALMARLEIASAQNLQLKQKKGRTLQLKLTSIREKEFKIRNPPQIIALPKHQLPDSKYQEYNLNGETNLAKFFRVSNEEKIQKENTEEPRHMTKILDKIDAKQLQKQLDSDRFPSLDSPEAKQKLLDDLPIKMFTKDNKLNCK